MMRNLNGNSLKTVEMKNKKEITKKNFKKCIWIKSIATFLLNINIKIKKTHIIFYLLQPQNLNVFESISLLNIRRWDNFHLQNAKTVSHDDNDDCKKGKEIYRDIVKEVDASKRI